MTQTEAYLTVLKAAELLEHEVPGCVLTLPDFGAQKLNRALRLVRPKVERMKVRLMDARKRRASAKTWVPSFIERAANQAH